MAFWSTEKFLAEVTKTNIVSEFDKKRLKYGRYYLRLGRDVLVTPDGSIDAASSGKEKYVKIPPGQFAILFTYESISVPNSAIGLISVRTPAKIKGLVNISGFHVDPGFKGHLQFSVYNAGNKTICLDYESECFLLWLCDLAGPADASWKTDDSWDKRNDFQKSAITAEDRERMLDGLQSPAVLHNRIKQLEDNVNAIFAVGLVIVFPLLIAFGVVVFERSFEETPNNVPVGKLIVITSLITCILIAAAYVGWRLWRSRRR